MPEKCYICKRTSDEVLQEMALQGLYWISELKNENGEVLVPIKINGLGPKQKNQIKICFPCLFIQTAITTKQIEDLINEGSLQLALDR